PRGFRMTSRVQNDHKDDVRMQADIPPDLAVLWDELQGLKDLVLSLKAAEVGQRQSLRNMESRLRDGEMEVEQQRHSMEGLAETLSQYRKEMINPALRTEADRKLIVVNTDLSKKVEKLEEQSKDVFSALALELPFLQTRLRASELTVEQLRRKSADDQKVAFSAGLTDSGPVGPFDEERTLIFSKVITDIGNAYNQTTGVFRAPVRGLYFFSFTAADYQKGYMGLHLYRNNLPIIFNLDLNDHGGYASTSNGVALQLEAGDEVRLSLPASYRLYDDVRNFSVFSGFLLFAI
uniref:C1q domain-containing protein n=1 Tax=Labrus bergylta TaxID=56723 RepID=A0A3Q3GM77_9LABR